MVLTPLVMRLTDCPSVVRPLGMTADHHRDRPSRWDHMRSKCTSFREALHIRDISSAFGRRVNLAVHQVIRKHNIHITEPHAPFYIAPDTCAGAESYTHCCRRLVNRHKFALSQQPSAAALAVIATFSADHLFCGPTMRAFSLRPPLNRQ